MARADKSLLLQSRAFLSIACPYVNREPTASPSQLQKQEQLSSCITALLASANINDCSTQPESSFCTERGEIRINRTWEKN